jgi:hypothetical protein
LRLWGVSSKMKELTYQEKKNFMNKARLFSIKKSILDRRTDSNYDSQKKYLTTIVDLAMDINMNKKLNAKETKIARDFLK